VSCTRALEFLEQKKIEVNEIIDARKDKKEEAEAWDILSKAEKLFVAKGKKVLEFLPSEVNKEEILKHSMGRSGTLRAPVLVTDTSIIVGYNQELYSANL
jgi:arsenate reductase-like glutaredoxin family protein